MMNKEEMKAFEEKIKALLLPHFETYPDGIPREIVTELFEIWHESLHSSFVIDIDAALDKENMSEEEKQSIKEQFEKKVNISSKNIKGLFQGIINTKSN